MSYGSIRSIKDVLVTVVFDDDMPDAHEVLVVEGLGAPLLVDSLQPGNIALCLNIQSNRQLQKGMQVARSGKSIEIPVGEEMIGRVVDALGLPIDGGPPIDGRSTRRNIFRTPERETAFSTATPQ